MVLDLDYDRSLHEKEHLAGPFQVTKEMIRAFTESIGDANPLFTNVEAVDGGAIPEVDTGTPEAGLYR